MPKSKSSPEALVIRFFSEAEPGVARAVLNICAEIVEARAPRPRAERKKRERKAVAVMLPEKKLEGMG